MTQSPLRWSLQVAGKMRKHRLLLLAGLEFLAAERTDAAVLAITQEAGVGQGTFYNHFPDKQTFYRESVEFGIGLVENYVDELTEDVTDPADAFVQRFRLVASLHRQVPALSQAIISRTHTIYSQSGGFADRIRYDVTEGVASGRFRCASVEGAVGTIIGSSMMLGQRIHDTTPDLDVDRIAADTITDLMVMLGVPRAEARELAEKPLPWTPFDIKERGLAEDTF